jgi:tubulin delta
MIWAGWRRFLPRLSGRMQANVIGSCQEGMQVAGHPAYKILTLRTVPQISQNAVKYTTFTWNAILKRLLQMFIISSTCPDSLDWSSAQASSHVAQGYRGGSNKSAGSFLITRGLFAPQVDVSAAAAPHFFPAWQPQPLQVVASKVPFRGYEMCSTLLSADKVWVSLSVCAQRSARGKGEAFYNGAGHTGLEPWCI